MTDAPTPQRNLHVGLPGPNAGVLGHEEPLLEQLGRQVVRLVEVFAVDEHHVDDVAPLFALGDPQHLTRVDIERAIHGLRLRLVPLGREGEPIDNRPVILFFLTIPAFEELIFP